MNEYKYGALKSKNYRFFGTSVKQIILKFLSENPGKRFSVLDIQRNTNLPGSSVSVALDELEEFGLVESIKEGKYRLYTLEKEFAHELSEVYDKLDTVYQIALKNKKKKE